MQFKINLGGKVELSREVTELLDLSEVSQDVYLFNGSQLPIIGDKIKAEGYDPDNPTPEAIAHVKKVCKHERGIAKVITLGASYGMGWAKLQLTLRLQGINISTAEAKALHGAYWELYGGVKDYEQDLLREHKENGGYVINGIGRPVGCARDYLKDIVNRVVQSTGHDIHMLYMQIVARLCEEQGVNVDGIVWDFHDQTILECDEQDKDLVYDILGRQAYDILNNEVLKGDIPLKGDPQHIKTMGDAKCGD